MHDSKPVGRKTTKFDFWIVFISREHISFKDGCDEYPGPVYFQINLLDVNISKKHVKCHILILLTVLDHLKFVAFRTPQP